MSDRDGGIPGARTGAPRHPPGTHEDGRDVDLAYYQRGTPDNRVRAICPHVLDGVDQRHCVAPPTTLDVGRTAALVCALEESAHVRVIGVDGQDGPLLEPRLRAMCPGARLAYEPIDEHRGWFYAHHNHVHVSWR